LSPHFFDNFVGSVPRLAVEVARIARRCVPSEFVDRKPSFTQQRHQPVQLMHLMGDDGYDGLVTFQYITADDEGHLSKFVEQVSPDNDAASRLGDFRTAAAVRSSSQPNSSTKKAAYSGMTTPWALAISTASRTDRIAPSGLRFQSSFGV